MLEGNLYVVLAFTRTEAAQALGRTLLTLRGWIKKGLIPDPYLIDTTYGYEHYSVGELEAIRPILDEHFRVYSQLQTNHEQAVADIHAAMVKYRAKYI